MSLSGIRITDGETDKRSGGAFAPQGSTAGLYLHIPFCSAICPYCDFSVLLGDKERRQRFTEGMIREIGLNQGSPLVFDTVYFGGGTPSALAVGQLRRILEAVRRHLSVVPDARVFLEANPEDVTPESLAAWRALGVETLSLGMQSFQREALSFLGRRHGPEEGMSAARMAVEAGFSTVSVDLIFGLPGQTPESWQRDLEAAVEVGPQHISCYQLTIHAGTPFGFRQARGELAEMPGDAQGDLFLLTHALLADHGFAAYEVSNFARGPEHQSRHNRKYWNHTPYLGLGPSAHSFYRGRRWWNHRKLGPWLAAVEAGEAPVEGEEILSGEELALEALMLGLRTTDGLDLGELERRRNVEVLAPNKHHISRLVNHGLAEHEGSWLRLKLPGLAVADGIVAGFEVLAAGVGE